MRRLKYVSLMSLVVLVAGAGTKLFSVDKLPLQLSSDQKVKTDVTRSFDYDRATPFDLKQESEKDENEVLVRDLNYAAYAAKHGRIKAYLVKPKSKGQFAGIVFFHWLGEVKSDRTEFLDEAIHLATSGTVSLLIEGYFPWKEDPVDGPTDRQQVIDQTIEVRRAFDLLLSQPEVDSNRVAFVGHDYGAMFGAITSGVDKRPKAFVLMAGLSTFSDWSLKYWPKTAAKGEQVYRDAIREVDPVGFVSTAAARSFLFQFASNDKYISKEAATAFYAAASEPKQIKWYDAKHDLQIASAAADRDQWLAQQLALKTAQDGGDHLREAADKAGLLVGTAVDPRLFANADYAGIVAREFNLIEPENQMKWGAIRPTRDAFNFKAGDEVVAFGEAHNQKVRGHCLLWSKYNPTWLANGKFTAEELAQLMHDHITTVVKHYAGHVFAWDVVNESFDERGGLEHSIWYDRPGIGLADKRTAYIEQAIRWAHEADPKALLFYNDYNVEGVNAKSDAMYAMLKDFKQRGVPVDGVGIQAHVFDLNDGSLASLAKNIERFGALGLQVHITELDVGLPLENGRPAHADDLKKQADIYRTIAEACMKNRACTLLQTWGFTDKYSWIPGFSRGAKGMALPFDQNYAAKPAYDALLNEIRRGR